MSELGLLLWSALGLSAFLVWRQWRPGARSAGLTICYLVSLGTIHFVGAWISTFSSYASENGTVVTIGFRECVAGVFAFVVGTVVAEAWRSRGQTSLGLVRLKSTGATRIQNWPDRGLPYVILGGGCAFFSGPLKSIPTVATLAHCGGFLAVAGVCLEFDRAFRTQCRSTAMVWVLGTAIFPVLTLLTSGFIGYGVYATAMVLCLVLVRYRPRWQCGLAFCALGYLGLSVYVTYMRERQELRSLVWQGEPYTARAQKVLSLLTQFEFFNPKEDQQLHYIDERLNQNYLVGMAAVQLELGLAPFARGRTVSRGFLSLIPRACWSGKPVAGGSGNLVTEYTGIPFVENTSVGVGQVMEFYINFGHWGTVLGFLLLGLVLRIIDWHAATCLEERNVPGFVLWYLPGLGLLQPGGCLVEVFGTCAASWAVAFIATRVYPSRARAAECVAKRTPFRAQVSTNQPSAALATSTRK